MIKNAFTEDDYNKVAEFLNFVYKKAEFPAWKTEDTIKHFKLLSHIQTVVLPKIQAHTLEVKEVVKVDPTKNEEPLEGKE